MGPSSLDSKESAREVSEHQRLLIWAAAALASYPTLGQQIKDGAVIIEGVAKGWKHSRKQHQWQWSVSFQRYLCQACLKSSVLQKKGNCSSLGEEASDRILAILNKGHQLARLGSSALVFCQKCGAYSEQRGRLLRQACQGSKCNQASKLKRLGKGWHPIRQLWVGEVGRLPTRKFLESQRLESMGQLPRELVDPFAGLMAQVLQVDEFSQPWPDREPGAEEEEAAWHLQGEDFWEA